MASNKVIILGATGGVGSFAALAAHEHGAQVVLALRDPQKPIPGISPATEQSSGFERVHADLTKPDTIRAAIAQTGAKRAFVYLAYGTPDHMRSSFAALKEAGIEFIVFLSGLAVSGNLASIPPEEFIPWAHAQAEIALGEVFDAGQYVAARPGMFATNLLHYKDMIAAGEVQLPYPEAAGDWIASEDTGAVCGALLAKGASALEGSETSIPLCGTRRISQEEAIKIVGRAIGKEVKVSGFDNDEDAARSCAEVLHLPDSIAKSLVKAMRDMAENSSGDVYAKVNYKEAVGNIRKYGGKEATRLEDWAQANKAKFVE